MAHSIGDTGKYAVTAKGRRGATTDDSDHSLSAPKRPSSHKTSQKPKGRTVLADAKYRENQIPEKERRSSKRSSSGKSQERRQRARTSDLQGTGDGSRRRARPSEKVRDLTPKKPNPGMQGYQNTRTARQGRSESQQPVAQKYISLSGQERDIRKKQKPRSLEKMPVIPGNFSVNYNRSVLKTRNPNQNDDYKIGRLRHEIEKRREAKKNPHSHVRRVNTSTVHTASSENIRLR